MYEVVCRMNKLPQKFPCVTYKSASLLFVLHRLKEFFFCILRDWLILYAARLDLLTVQCYHRWFSLSVPGHTWVVDRSFSNIWVTCTQCNEKRIHTPWPWVENTISTFYFPLSATHWKIQTVVLANTLVTTLARLSFHANSKNACSGPVVVKYLQWEASEVYTRAMQIQSEVMP